MSKRESKRDEMRRRRQQKSRRQQLPLIAGVVLLAVAVTGWLIYQNTRPLGEIVTIEKETWPLADGKALGPPDARVVVMEFSDFQ